MKNELDLNILDLYIKEASSYSLLSKAELSELLKEYHNGNLNAKEKIINSNLRLVIKIAQKYCKKTSSMALLDLIQEGNIGLTKAIETYDKDKSSFSTYASRFIEGQILSSIRNSDKIIRRPKYIYDLQHKYDKYIEKYYEIYKKNPDDEIVKEELDITDEILLYLKNSSIFKVDSYNKKANENNDNEDEIIDLLGESVDKYDELINDIESFDYLNVIKDVLNDEDYYILYYRILVDESNRLTLKKIADEFNVSEQRITQKVKTILRKIRPYCKKDGYKFCERCDTIKIIYGKMYHKLDTKPIEPEKICLFLYLKDNLNILEQKMLYFLLLYRVKYSIEDLQEMFKMDNQEITILYNTILNLLNSTINSGEFEEYKIKMLREKGSSIYKEELLSLEGSSELKKMLI